MKTIRKKQAKGRPKTLAEWAGIAERELNRILSAAASVPAVKKLGPRPASAWTASVSLIGAPAMTQLNSMYRGKKRPTDVLSFSSPDVFRQQGHLGELVVCLPVLKRQARELKHPPELELKILLIHGLLHLLGLDHERGPQQAAEQGRLEHRILSKLTGRSRPVRGLIQRAE